MDSKSAAKISPHAPIDVYPNDEFEPGRRVRIVRGALAGLEGIVRERCDDFRLLVKLDAQHRGVLVTIDHDVVQFTD